MEHGGGASWKIQRRYNEFRQVHQSLAGNCGFDLEFPGKKITGNKDREFIAARQAALQGFISMLCSHPSLKHSMTLKNFLSPYISPGLLFIELHTKNYKVLFQKFLLKMFQWH